MSCQTSMHRRGVLLHTPRARTHAARAHARSTSGESSTPCIIGELSMEAIGSGGGPCPGCGTKLLAGGPPSGETPECCAT